MNSRVVAETSGSVPEPQAPSEYQRIVVKAGTSLLTGGGDRLDLQVMAGLVAQIARLVKQGKEVLLVSSGAIAAGRHQLGIGRDQKSVPFRQVLAAVGQSRLMWAWDQLFRWHDLTVAQTLLTRNDLRLRSSYLNARNTLLSLLELKVVPIINENDVVAVDEIKEAQFGDNDNLSALVANMVDADLLVLLTDIAGLYTGDPSRDPEARLIPWVERIDAEIEKLAGRAGSTQGTGGMVTKLQAAKLASASGTSMAIADGREADVLDRLMRHESVGTFFPAKTSKLEGRKRWMVSGLSNKGKLVIDAGAVNALCRKGSSLLPAGILEVGGRFERGDSVVVEDNTGRRLGYGISNYASADIAAIKGQRSDRIQEVLGFQYGDEVVHRNNLVLLSPEA